MENKIKITRDEPKIKKLIRSLEKTNPWVKFIYSYERNNWILEWQFKGEKLNINQINSLIASLEAYKISWCDLLNKNLSQIKREEGGYMDIDD